MNEEMLFIRSNFYVLECFDQALSRHFEVHLQIYLPVRINISLFP